MSQLPANPQTASTPSLPERAEHREWIGGRALTLLSHFWRDDDPVELTAAIGADWADVLEGLPQEFIQRACVKYLKRGERKKPQPGDIYQIAKGMMPAPEVVKSAPPEPREPREPPVSDEKRRQILSEAGFHLNEHGGVIPGASFGELKV